MKRIISCILSLCLLCGVGMLNCTHVHNEDCGIKGVKCTHECYFIMPLNGEHQKV